MPVLKVVIVTALAALAVLTLTLSACGQTTGDPSENGAQAATPNIGATVQAALRSLENTQLPTVAQSADPTTAPVQPATPATVPNAVSSSSPPSDATHTPTPRLAATATAMSSPTSPPTVEVTPTAEIVRSTAVLPTATPEGAGQRAPAPMFAGTFMDGNDYQLDDTVGTPTLLMFWAPW